MGHPIISGSSLQLCGGGGPVYPRDEPYGGRSGVTRPTPCWVSRSSSPVTDFKTLRVSERTSPTTLPPTRVYTSDFDDTGKAVAPPLIGTLL